jgi:hypothetical protein
MQYRIRDIAILVLVSIYDFSTHMNSDPAILHPLFLKLTCQDYLCHVH